MGPYWMVGISIFSSLALLFGLGIYRYIWPKKKIDLLALVILISLLPVVSIFRPGSYESGDLTLHAVRFISFYRSLLEGNIIPQWSGELNAGFGEPVFIFAPTPPYHISAVFRFLGFSYLDSLKLFLALSFVASGIIMYLWAKNEFGKLPGFAASVLYLFAPYHFVNIHFRANPGETLAFVFPPLTMLAIRKIFQTNARKWVFLSAVSSSLLILAHPIAIITFPFVVLYSFYLFLTTKKAKSLVISIFSLLIGVALSAYYWLPEIVLSKFTHQALYHIKVVFQNLIDFLYSPWMFGLLFQGHFGELSFALGYSQLLLLALCLIFIVKGIFSKKEKGYALFFLTIFFLTIFLMLEISSPIWEMFPIFKNLQFAYRLMVLEVLILAIIGGLVAKKLPKKIVIIICIFTIGSTILNWGNRRTIREVNDAYLIKQLPQSSYLYEGSAPSAPIWTDPNNVWVKDPPQSYLEVITGEAVVKQTLRISTKHEYDVLALSKTRFKENALYFPGWTVSVNDKDHPINYQDKRYPGVITFELPPGVYKIEVIYKITNIQYFARLISLTTFVLLVIYVLFPRRKLNWHI